MRELNGRLYLTAFVITVVVFILGLLAGLVIEGQRVEYMTAQGELQAVNFDSIQLQYLYLSGLQNNKSCTLLSNALNKYIHETDEIRTRLEQYTEKSNIKYEDFALLKRKYTLTQINYWYLARKTKELCSEDYLTVLYFYDKDSDESRNQGFILDYFKKKFKDRILIFAIDSKFAEEPMVQMLKESYQINQEPTIIVGDTKMEGFQSTDKLQETFCNLYASKPEECT